MSNRSLRTFSDGLGFGTDLPRTVNGILHLPVCPFIRLGSDAKWIPQVLEMAHHDASKVTIRLVILTSWKEIAQYLKGGVRTVQRWESDGLPIKRPYPGKRSHVVADSSQLDSWVHDNAFWRAKDSDLLNTIVRNRALRAETRKARADLHSKMQGLRKELAALRANRRQPKT